ncbi:pre-rRNA 2'-O-ribose RNA methyltransferase FTSJ3-like [Phodopus roborovskii]|uniref:pre-rRNA 2'-O-ribose RNA methyltransferase FTSJ3-like n=1 Tax=Phodopus roborovskii TaxID=109678 RepID=UPI0021E44A34|nr:pre-rRNA 2'-O-ribose RNA methyltransferase FTSJ3-like [Phodopus roborovskii]
MEAFTLLFQFSKNVFLPSDFEVCLSLDLIGGSGCYKKANRKKRRMLKKLEQTKKKAEAVVNTVDISEREKVAQLRSLYKKAGLGKEKRQVTYVVAKKGLGRKVRWPAGVKGQFKVVDSRMKKDLRAQQRKEQKKKHKRK